MTVDDVLRAVRRYNNIELSDQVGIDWLNLFQHDVSFNGGPVNEHTFNEVLAGTPYTLPSDFIVFEEAVMSDGTILSIDQVDIALGKIKFGIDDDAILLRYVQVPPELVSSSNPLSVNSRFHPIAYLFLLSMFYDMEGEGDPEESTFAERYFRRYEFRKEQIISEIRQSSTGPVKTTDVLPYRHKIASQEDKFF